MSIKFSALTAVVLFASGCAQNGTVKPPQEPDPSSPVASATGRDSSSLALQAASGAPSGKTCAQGHAAVEL